MFTNAHQSTTKKTYVLTEHHKIIGLQNLGLVEFDENILAQVKKIQLVCLLPFKVIKAKSSSGSVVRTFYYVLWCIYLFSTS